MKSYVAFVHRRGEEATISFPDLPGCGAAHFLADHLNDLIKAGEAIPSPSSILEIVSAPEWQAESVEAIILAVRPVAAKCLPEGAVDQPIRGLATHR